jgi:hypothetical protein
VAPPPIISVAPPVVPVPVAPPVVSVKEAAPVAFPVEQANQPEERVRTSPFAPLPSPTPAFVSPFPRMETPNLTPAVRAEPGLAMRPEPIVMRGTPEVVPVTQPQALILPSPAPSRAEAKPADAQRAAPMLSPSIPNRRPGMSQSMQTETVGSFLRRFRLATE